MTIRAGLAIVALLVVAILVRSLVPGGLAGVVPGGGRPTLVVIVPGTFGNTAFWTNVVPGQTTFASELQRAMTTVDGAATDVVPFLWASSTAHADRVAAAQNLAKLIDDKGPAYGRVCLVSHSHGGNVALLAAGLCHTHVDTVVCLSTPHLHLRTRSAAGAEVNVPIYCTAATVRNVGRIVSVWPDTDRVPDGWANWQTGITDNEAVGLTTDARAALGDPRLADDGGPISDLILGGPQRVFAEATLENVPIARRAVVQSDVPDGFGSGAHSAVHSRRMGYVVGRLLAEGASDAAVEEVATLVQPADVDDGGPVPASSAAESPSADAPAGWRLVRAAVDLRPESKAAAGNLDGSDPASYLTVTRHDAGGDVTVLTTASSPTSGYAPTWTPRLVCTPGRGYTVGLWAHHSLPFVADTDLGERPLTVPASTGTPPPAGWPPALDSRIYWGATLAWQAVHY